MTITKEQIARLRQLAKNCIPTDQPYSDKVINRYVLEASESVLQTEMHPEFVIALLDEVERLQIWCASMGKVLSSGVTVTSEEYAKALNERGARVFDAVMNELAEEVRARGLARFAQEEVTLQRFAVSALCMVSDHIESQRERILGGGER